MHRFTPISTRKIHKFGFTLVELLVVVAIIVVLMALLIPAMDKAIYQAELAACGANLKGMGSGSMVYAIDNKRRYFYREAVMDTAIPNYQPRYLTAPYDPLGQKNNMNGYDDRASMGKAFPLKMLRCPLTADVQLESAPASTTVVAGYSIWAGWKYNYASDSSDPSTGGMLRAGQKINYNGKNYDVLAGDTVIGFMYNIYASHPEDKQVLALRSYNPQTAPPPVNGSEEQRFTVSEYFGSMGTGPGVFDLNFARDDGSVIRIDKTEWGNGEAWGNDYNPRMDVLPMNKDGTNGWGQISIPTGR